MSTQRLLIMSCSGTKKPDAGGMPAIERYDGPAYRVLRRAIRERPGLAESLMIRFLSAEFGLISPQQQIPDYNRRMNRARAIELAPAVAAALPSWPPAFVFASHLYRLALHPSPWPVSVQVAHGGIGKQLHQLRVWLEAQEGGEG